MKSKTIRFIFATFAILFVSVVTFAQGVRYTSVQYQVQSADASTFTVKFRLEQIYDGGSPLFSGKSIGDTVAVADIHFGDGDVLGFSLLYDEDLPNGSKKGVAEGEHTYAITPTGYDAYILFWPRTNTLVVNTSGPWRVSGHVSYPFNGYQSPAINMGVPISIVADPLNSVTGSIDVGVAVLSDNNSGNLTYSLPPGVETGMIVSPLPPFTSYSIDANTGVISYELAAGTVPGDYATQVKIEDEQGGSVTTDFIISVVNCTNPVPTFINPTPASGTEYIINPGQTLSFDIVAQSNDVNANTSFSAIGIPFGATYTPDAVPGNPYSATFSWTPSSTDIGLRSLTFTAQNTSGCERTTTHHIRIRVQTPVPDAFLTPVDSCSDDPTIYEWKIFNQETFNVPYSWEIVGSNPLVSGLGYAPPGYNYLTTNAADGNELKITWFDSDGLNQATLVWNGGSCSCDASDDVVAIIDASAGGAACGSLPFTYYDGLSGAIDLEAQVVGGLSGPYTYLWSTGETTQTISVTPTATTTYSVAITDANGCTATATVEVLYCDVRVYDKKGDVNSKKVKICHYPPGNPGNVQTIIISINALCTHITQHGDQIGDCNDCGPGAQKKGTVDFEEATSLNVFPNPTAGNFNIEYNMPEAGDVSIMLTDMTGAVVYNEAFSAQAGLYEHNLDFSSKPAGIYLLKVTLNADEYTMKVNLLD